MPAVQLADTHCHVNVYPGVDALRARARAQEVFTVVVTSRPSEYRNSVALFDGGEWTALGLGFHPEAAGCPGEAQELEIFARHVADAAWIAEVGLDARIADSVSQYFGNVPTLAKQERLLSSLLALDVAGKPFSVHSRGAEGRLVDMLGDAGVASVIFHWFHGDRAAARRVLDAGYRLSVNPAMLATDAGRDLCAWLPADRLLLETDGPFVPWGGRPAEPGDLPDVLHALAALRDADATDLGHQIRRNFIEFLPSPMQSSHLKEQQ